MSEPLPDAYLAQFPTDHRETADKAYQDGHIDGAAELAAAEERAEALEGEVRQLASLILAASTEQEMSDRLDRLLRDLIGELKAYDPNDDSWDHAQVAESYETQRRAIIGAGQQ